MGDELGALQSTIFAMMGGRVAIGRERLVVI
jgi:hypothetical protein